ncbi:hypothetical protein K1719_000464 [Acacia pycnantha]|nr:hypothetical protein K1719_000464 [Acacia pycnantha]
MASSIVKRATCSAVAVLRSGASLRSYARVASGTDIIAAASNVSLQKARSWDDGVSSKFSTTPLEDIFKDKKVVIFGLPGAYTGVCSNKHVPAYKDNIEKFKSKGIDSVICVSINDPYVMNAWAEGLRANNAIEFYGDFDGSFHKSLDLTTDLSGALLGTRSQRWSAYVVDGKVKALNIEEAPSDVKVSGAETILEQI